MIRVLLLGAGGHAQVIADILLQLSEQGGDLQPIGFLDDNPTLVGQRRLGLPVLGTLAQLDRIPHDALLIGIGHNPTRCRLYQQLQEQGEQFVSACHPRSIVAPGVSIGLGSVVCAGVVINTAAQIGPNVILNTSCSVDHHNYIAEHAHIAPGARLGGDVQIGAGALIGMGAIVMPQRTVGDWSTVGAGALVHQHVPCQATVVGVPARIMHR